MCVYSTWDHAADKGKSGKPTREFNKTVVFVTCEDTVVTVPSGVGHIGSFLKWH